MQRGEHTIARLYKAHDGGPALNCSYTTCETETGELEQLAVVIELLSNSEGAKAINSAIRVVFHHVDEAVGTLVRIRVDQNMPDILLHTTCSHETEIGGERNGIRIIGTIELVLVLELIEGGHRSTESRSDVGRRMLEA